MIDYRDKGGREDLILHLRRARRLLTTRQVAVLLGKHQETIYRMIASGFPAVRDGCRWKFDSSKVADWLERRTIGAETEVP
jgi:excisionase family DNA binding protein